MRVGILDYTTGGQRSGVEYYTLGIIHSLAAHTKSVELVIYTNDVATISSVAPMAVIRKIPGRTCRAFRLLWQHTCLPGAAEADKLDVLHCPAYVMPLLSCRIPCVITVHDTHALNRPQWCSVTNRLHYGIALPHSLRHAAAVVAVSQDTYNDILNYCRAARDRIRVIPPGIDNIFTNTRDTAVEERCRHTYRLPHRYILQVGNIEPRKGLPQAIEAMRRLRKKGIDRKLVLVGQMRQKSKRLSKHLAEAEREGVVLPLGYVPRADLPSLYRMADVFLCLSQHEGFGFPPLEAMACGTPVISSMTGATRDTLADAAIPVDPESPAAVAAALVEVLTDDTLTNRLKIAGLQRTAEHQWPNTVVELLNTYKILCD